MPDFTIADADFDRQASILRSLLTTVQVSSRQDGINKHIINGVELPLIPAGGQNTMAAAAVVLLAAHFEEYVRQQVEEYAKAVVLEYASLPSEFRDKLVDTYWKSGAAKLGRIRPKGDPGWLTRAEPVLKGLIAYPIGGDLNHFVAALLCEHDNNMRWDTISDLTGRVGIKKFSGLLHKSAPLKAHLGSPKVGDMTEALRLKLNAFYELRNGIVHSISQNSGIGTSVFDQWADFFSLLTTAIAESFASSYVAFEAETEKRKAKAAA